MDLYIIDPLRKGGQRGLLGSPRGHGWLDSTAVSIFVVILVELTNTVFVNSTNIATKLRQQWCLRPASRGQLRRLMGACKWGFLGVQGVKGDTRGSTGRFDGSSNDL